MTEFLPMLAVVDTYFREIGHSIPLCQLIRREMTKLSCPTTMLLPISAAGQEYDFPFEAILPSRPRDPSVLGALLFTWQIFWSLRRRKWAPATTLFWPVVGLPELLAGFLLALLYGSRIPQIFWLQIPLNRTGRLTFLFRSFALADSFNRKLGWGWRFIPTTDEIGAGYARLGVRGVEPALDLCVHFAPGQPASGDPCTLAYLGEARDVKGFHLAVDLALKMRDRGLSQFRFLYQVNPASEAAPQTTLALRRLQEEGKHGLELICGRIDDRQYQQILERATFILMPYDPAFYAEVPSGVCAEALAAGRPIIATQGTRMADLVQRNGCGLTFDFDHPEQFEAVVLRAWEQRQNLCQNAWRQREEWMRGRTPEYLARRLFGARE